MFNRKLKIRSIWNSLDFPYKRNHFLFRFSENREHLSTRFHFVFHRLPPSLSLYRIYSLFLPFFVLPAIEAYELRKEQNHKNQNVIWQTHMDYAVKQLND